MLIRRDFEVRNFQKNWNFITPLIQMLAICQDGIWVGGGVRNDLNVTRFEESI